jgi:dUTP pyrophosphatase
MPDALSTTLMRVRKLHPEAAVPRYQTVGAAGLDLAALLPDGSVTVKPGQIVRVPTGLALEIPEGFEGQVRPRSGLATKHGVTVVNAPGTIDSDYRGELQVALINLGSEAFTIAHGTRMAQLVIAPVVQVDIQETTELTTTGRAGGGFGSTGMG